MEKACVSSLFFGEIGQIRHFLKLLLNRIVPVLLVFLALIGLWFFGQRLETSVYDFFIRESARPAADSPVLLVLIDDESVERLSPRFGPLPWPRSAYLEIFKAIGKEDPAVIVFDSHFANLKRGQDDVFIEALRNIPDLVVGLALDDRLKNGLKDSLKEPIEHPKKPDPAKIPDPEFLPSFHQLKLGVVNTGRDSDGLIRRLQPVFGSRENLDIAGVYPSLSLEGVYQYLNNISSDKGGWSIMSRSTGGGGQQLELVPGQGREQALRIPLDKDQTFLIRWYALKPGISPGEYDRSHDAIALWRFFEPQESGHPIFQEKVRDKIVLVGASSVFYRDYHPTPMSSRHLGADIHATAMDNYLSSQALVLAPDWQQWLLLAVFAGSVFALRFRLGMYSRHFGLSFLYAVGLMMLYFLLVYMLFSFYGLVLPLITPEIFMLAAFLAASLLREATRDRQVRMLERNLSQLVSQDVFQEIQRMGHNLTSGGQRQEITSMFVDIRNFMPLAESLPAHELTALLNEFYGVIESVVFTHRGTVDKYMGDGVLIMFGAPLPDERHATLALAAAEGILAETGKLFQRWETEKKISVGIGISISSGMAFVGFLGPPQKLEYTAVGDTVNLCVRLQEENKRFNVSLVVSEETVQHLSSPIAEKLVMLGDIPIRGKEQPVKIYTLERSSSGGSASSGSV